MSARKVWVKACLGVLATVGINASNAAPVGTDEVIAGLRWGDGVAALKQRFEGLEPDLCSASERGYYEAMQWSCEGFAKKGLVIAGTRFYVRVRMSSEVYGLAGLSMLTRIEGTKTDRLGRSMLLDTCEQMQKILTARFGGGSSASNVMTREAVKVVASWRSERSSSDVTLACVEAAMNDYGEVLVTLDQATGRNELGKSGMRLVGY